MDYLHNLDWFFSIRTPTLTTVAFAFTWLGYATFIMFFMAIGYWAWSKAIFFRVLLLIGFSAILNAYCKDLFQSARPPLSVRLDDLVGDSYGIPSGHAQLALVIWMWLAYEIRRAWAWVICTAIAVGVILSRLYLAAHYEIDVLIGALLGGLTLTAFVQIKDRRWFWQVNPLWRVALVVLGMAVTMATWPRGGTAPDYVPLLGGWLLGGIVGLHFETRILGFSVSPILLRRALAAVLGVVCFIALQKCMAIIGAHVEIFPFVWNVTKGVVDGIFVALLMPWLLAKMKLVSVGANKQ